MALWQLWIDCITAGLTFLGTSFGLSEAGAIIALTAIARIGLLPASWLSAYRLHHNRQATDRLKPQIAELQQRWKEQPRELARRTLALYRAHGIRFLDRATLVNIGTQGIVGIGIFQALRHLVFGSNFLWIANIGKPDFLLSLLVGTLTFISMLLTPGAAEHSTLLLYAIPAIVSMLALISFPSAIGIYWATSSIISAMQTVALRVVVARQHRQESKS